MYFLKFLSNFIEKSLKRHKRGVWYLKFTQDLHVSGSYDGTIRVSAEQIQMIKRHKHSVCYLKFTQDLHVSGSYDGTIRVSAEQIMKGHNRCAWCLKFFTHIFSWLI